MKKNLKLALLAFLVAVILTAAGTAVFTFYGYKDNIWIQGTGYVLVVFGWLIFAFLLFGIHIKIRDFLKARVRGFAKIISGFLFLIYPLWLIILVVTFMKLDYFKNAYVQKTLSNGDVVLTTAKVLRREERRIKTTSRVYAVIEYNAGGKLVQQAIRDDYGRFYNTKEIRIKYSKEHEDMFVVMENSFHPQ